MIYAVYLLIIAIVLLLIILYPIIKWYSCYVKWKTVKKEYDKYISYADKRIEDKEKIISGLNSVISEKTKKVNAQKSIIYRRDKRIEKLLPNQKKGCNQK